MDKGKTIAITIISIISLCFAFMFYRVFFNSRGSAQESSEEMRFFRADDSEMNKAIEKGRSTFLQNVPAALTDSNKETLVKVGLPTVGGSKEHIWLQNIRKLNGNEFEGEIANEPVDLGKIKLGDRIKFTQSIVSDWIIFGADGSKKGGFTTEVQPSQ